jgi:hypothetical protein
MASWGWPADNIGQTSLGPNRQPISPAPPISPKLSLGECTSSLPVPHAKVVAWEAPVVTTLSIGAST